MADELAETVHNMFSNVNVKNFDEVAKKYNGILSTEELLKEYQNDEDFEVDVETMNGSNVSREEIKFDWNGKQ